MSASEEADALALRLYGHRASPARRMRPGGALDQVEGGYSPLGACSTEVPP